MKKASPSQYLPLPVQVFCNGVPESHTKKRKCKKISLEYRSGQNAPQNVQLLLTDFIRGVFHLPARIQDLLEIAAYVFCADRYVSRGNKEAVEYHSWSRDFKFFIKVRDADFWNSEKVAKLLNESLTWMTGDRSHSFIFLPGHTTDKADIFDSDEFSLSKQGVPRIVLFSGGMDSLAGIIELLETSIDSVLLISHRSKNPSTVRTQQRLMKALEYHYPGRINYRILECHLYKFRAPEESQRTRAFLYCSMALALANALKQSDFYIYENGVTALNFPKRAGMINARASRTTHPKTIRLLKELFSLIIDQSIEIRTPFTFKTKTDVVEVLKKFNRLDLMNSSVSCSKTFKELGQATHCGRCSQCIDRRFAAYASECDSADEGGIYAFDFINEQIDDSETKTGIIDYLRQARQFLHWNIDHFYAEMLDQLADAVDSSKNVNEQVEQIHSLCQRHGKQVQKALQRMVIPLEDYTEGSLKTLLKDMDFSRPPVYALANQLTNELEEYIHRAFVHEKPKDENDLNAKIDAYLSGHKEKFQKEHPCLYFATSRTIPDHSNANLDLLIEAKYIRGTTLPSKATDGIAADLIKYPDESLKLFIVYDPEGKISDRSRFKKDFEYKYRCIIHIVG